MSPEEIIERVKVCVQGGRDYCRSMDLGEPTTIQHCSDIDHLLAIHAAAVEFFTAQKAYEDAMNNADEFEAWDGHNCDEPQDRMLAARTKLADLCGWKAEQP